MTTPALAPPWPGTDTWMPTAFALGVPAVVAEGAPVEPVSASTAMNPIRIDCRRATWPQIIGDGGGSPLVFANTRKGVATRVTLKLRITIIAMAMDRGRRTEQGTQASAEPANYRGLVLPGRARLTPQREALLDLIAERPGSFTAVELLRRTGSVRPLAGDARPAYVRCEPGHHHHLICLACGAVEETELCGAPSPAELQRRYGFQAEGHELDVYGTCVRCA